MNNDELQVLGTPKKKRKNIGWVILAIIAAVAVIVGFGFFINQSPEEPIKIKTGKKMGESTIVP